MLRKIIYSILTLFLFIQIAYASGSTESEITINSPPELIAEDFLEVTVVPKPWAYSLWSWFGTDQIDIRNLTDADFNNYIPDKETRKKIKGIYDEFMKLDSFKDGDVLEKITNKIRVRLPNDEIISRHVNELVIILEQLTSLEFDILKVDDTHFTKNTLYIYTVGKTRESDICLNCPATANYRFETPMFKGITLYRSITSVDYISKNYTKMSGVWDNVIVFTSIPSFHKNKGSMFHVEGKYNFDNNHEIDGAECRIYKEHNEKIKRALTTECLLRSLGLPQLSNITRSNLGARSNNIDAVEWHQYPTLYDLLLIKILYDERIIPGMSKKELFPIVRNVINSIKIDSLKEYLP